MVDTGQSIWRAVSRGAAAAGFVAGIVSFIYGLSSSSRLKWIWILVGIFLLAALAKPILDWVTEVYRRYTEWPSATQELRASRAEVATLRAELREAQLEGVRNGVLGIQEGMDRMSGVMCALSMEVRAGHFDMAHGVARITSRVEKPSMFKPERARLTLVHRDSGTVVAILAAAEIEDNVLILAPTAYVDPIEWDRIVDKAVAGESVPTGLVLRPSALDDYDTFQPTS